MASSTSTLPLVSPRTAFLIQAFERARAHWPEAENYLTFLKSGAIPFAKEEELFGAVSALVREESRKSTERAIRASHQYQQAEKTTSTRSDTAFPL